MSRGAHRILPARCLSLTRRLTSFSLTPNTSTLQGDPESRRRLVTGWLNVEFSTLFKIVSHNSRPAPPQTGNARREIGIMWQLAWEDYIYGTFDLSGKFSSPLIFWQNVPAVVAIMGSESPLERPVWAASRKSFDLPGLRQTGPNIAAENSVKAISFGFLFSLTQDPRLCFCVPLSPLSPWQFITCYSDYHFNYRVACHNNPDSAR